MKLRHAAALSLMVLVCTSSARVAFPGEGCQDKLVGNSYDCTILFDSGETGAGGGFVEHNCFEFVPGKTLQQLWTSSYGNASSFGDL